VLTIGVCCPRYGSRATVSFIIMSIMRSGICYPFTLVPVRLRIVTMIVVECAVGIPGGGREVRSYEVRRLADSIQMPSEGDHLLLALSTGKALWFEYAAPWSWL
jgi:hypothetical protein